MSKHVHGCLGGQVWLLEHGVWRVQLGWGQGWHRVYQWHLNLEVEPAVAVNPNENR